MNVFAVDAIPPSLFLLCQTHKRRFTHPGIGIMAYRGIWNWKLLMISVVIKQSEISFLPHFCFLKWWHPAGMLREGRRGSMHKRKIPKIFGHAKQLHAI
jgi:hypothetical protein